MNYQDKMLKICAYWDVLSKYWSTYLDWNLLAALTKFEIYKKFHKGIRILKFNIHEGSEKDSNFWRKFKNWLNPTLKLLFSWYKFREFVFLSFSSVSFTFPWHLEDFSFLWLIFLESEPYILKENKLNFKNQEHVQNFGVRGSPHIFDFSQRGILSITEYTLRFI